MVASQTVSQLLDIYLPERAFFGRLSQVISMSKVVSKRIVQRPYTKRVAEREFVRAVLSRKVTPEVEAFTCAATERSRAVRTAPFLEQFRQHHAAA